MRAAAELACLYGFVELLVNRIDSEEEADEILVNSIYYMRQSETIYIYTVCITFVTHTLFQKALLLYSI